MTPSFIGLMATTLPALPPRPATLSPWFWTSTRREGSLKPVSLRGENPHVLGVPRLRKRSEKTKQNPHMILYPFFYTPPPPGEEGGGGGEDKKGIRGRTP